MSSSNRKARGDAKLKVLEPALQKAIFERCNGEKYKETVLWLRAEFEIETSVGALSDFYTWYQLKQRVAVVDSHVRDLESLITESGFQVDPKQMRDAMAAIFLSEASKKGDFKIFRGAMELLIKSDKNAIEFGKLELLQKKARTLDLVEGALGETKPEESAEDVQKRVMAIIDQAMGVKPRTATAAATP